MFCVLWWIQKAAHEMILSVHGIWFVAGWLATSYAYGLSYHIIYGWVHVIKETDYRDDSHTCWMRNPIWGTIVYVFFSCHPNHHVTISIQRRKPQKWCSFFILPFNAHSPLFALKCHIQYGIYILRSIQQFNIWAILLYESHLILSVILIPSFVSSSELNFTEHFSLTTFSLYSFSIGGICHFPNGEREKIQWDFPHDIAKEWKEEKRRW